MKRKSMLALAAAAALIGGCATGPYYDRQDSYAYEDGRYYDRAPTRYYEPAPAYYAPYYAPYYVGPSIGLGFSFSSRGHWHRR